MSTTRVLLIEIQRLPPLERHTHRLDQAGVSVIRSLLDGSFEAFVCQPSSFDFEADRYVPAKKHLADCHNHPHVISIHRNSPLISLFTCCVGWFDIPRDAVTDPLVLDIEDPEAFLKALLDWVDEHVQGLHHGGAHGR